jgi:hypothetical protein
MSPEWLALRTETDFKRMREDIVRLKRDNDKFGMGLVLL